MRLQLKRVLKAKDYTAGELYINGIFECFTIEDAVRDLDGKCRGKEPGKTAIPQGSYEIALTYSNRFAKYLPLLLNVPCFDGIRIHSGNSAADTEGCLIVGKEKSASGQVFQSRAAFSALMSKLKGVEKKEKIFIDVA